MLKIAIILGSTRPGRNGEAVARWVHEKASKRKDATYELVDLAEQNLPLLDEAKPASMGQYEHAHTKAWASKIAGYDGFVFVTAEYNHAIPGALKNAIDFLFAEWNDKAAGFVSYGSAGGTRAVEQLSQDPAIQGSVDLATDPGFYAGVWASNVDFGPGDPNVEVDYYAGWGGGEEITWDLGIVYYTYVSASDLNYPEYYGSLGWRWLEVKAWYGSDYGGLDGKNEHYYEFNGTYELPANFGLVGHIGYSNGDGIKTAYGQSSYYDWAVGVTYTWSHFDMSLKWVDGEDLKTLQDGTCDPFTGKCSDVGSSEARAIFQISTTFPWKKEGEE